MFSKLVKALFKETTNTKDISSVTFNSSGTYNPRYGKQKVYVSGKGGDGSYAAGTPYYNYSPAYSYNQYVGGNSGTGYNPVVPGNSGTNSPYYNPPQPMPGFFYPGNYSNIYGTYFPGGYQPPYSVSNLVPGTSYSNPPSGGNEYYYDNSYSYSVYVPASTPYGGTNANVTNTGTTTNVLGIPLPGGVGTTASVVPSTRATSIPNYGTPYSVTVPSGGYVTITFTL